MAVGTTTVNFGAFPGKSDTSVAITGQTSILSNSFVEAWLVPTATADHSADEHLLEQIKIIAGNVVAGTGFTIYALCNSEIEGCVVVQGCMNNNSPQLYGLWTVAWVWS
jgi:hypothetical protein